LPRLDGVQEKGGGGEKSSSGPGEERSKREERKKSRAALCCLKGRIEGQERGGEGIRLKVFRPLVRLQVKKEGGPSNKIR